MAQSMPIVQGIRVLFPEGEPIPKLSYYTTPADRRWAEGTEILKPLRPFSIRQRTIGMPGAPALKGQELIRAAYEQVFGTKLLLDTFRVPVLESKLLNSELSIREFVRSLAKSEYYFVTFYQGCSNNRFVELSFKHLLGRAAFSQREIFDYSSIASRRGFAALVDALVDSPEYQQTFGEDTLPYWRKMHEGPEGQGFDRVGITDPGLLTALDLIGNPTTSSYIQVKAPTFTLCDYSFNQGPAPLITESTHETVTEAPVKPATDSYLDRYKAMALDVPSARSRGTVSNAEQLREQLLPPGGSWSAATADELQALTQPANRDWTRGTEAITPLRSFSIRQRSVDSASSPALSGEALLRACYRQVYGTDLLLETFRNRVLESKLFNGDLFMREFVRALAKSEYYFVTFYQGCSNNRFVELSFKHLLGRAPVSQRELFNYSSIASRQGFAALIDALIDSEEYQTTFGDTTLPYARKMHEGVASQGFDRVGITDAGLLTALDLMGNPTTSSYVQAKAPGLTVSDYRKFERSIPSYPTARAAAPETASMAQQLRLLTTPASTSWMSGTEALTPLRAFSIRQKAMNTANSPALDGEALLKASYRQVFGTDLLLETFRNRPLESKLMNGDLTLREFVRALAKSEYCFVTFYQGCSNNRFVELSFKHLLGRAPVSRRELFDYSSIASRQGFAALIDSLVNSDEYLTIFGENTLPYARKMHEGTSRRGFDSVGITDAGLLTALDLIGNPTTSSYIQAKAPGLTVSNYDAVESNGAPTKRRSTSFFGNGMGMSNGSLIAKDKKAGDSDAFLAMASQVVPPASSPQRVRIWDIQIPDMTRSLPATARR
ncbi:phycobilisome rod-core linker polypeptide [Candidatus Cyanaurora vandensis]|uniref:phycobilisome rod-core linker polypeptide n=1 Tax=Candidatus Cyanaurora vandensis TaxID=2714958 RepID=UPI00257A5829|nr:phycobilisome rod-core linker polypeptide [Candidatus Cyanaurora vandensis]